ncbi:MAG: S9 family peptidase [Acidobacteria bacterium]|nr:S9 family peptidase [Acidobacteriota bacterium]
MKHILVWLAVACSLCQPVFTQKRLLTIDDLYDPDRKTNFEGSAPSGLRWLADSTHYIQRKKNPGENLTSWLKVHAVTGRQQLLFSMERLQSAFLALPGFSSKEALNLASEGVFQYDGKESLLISYARDLFYYNINSHRALRLTNSPQEELEAEFSPDGKMVSFVRDNNIYVVDLAGPSERQITVDGSATLLNGILDWIYQEEIYGRGHFKGYWWSPDSTLLAYLQLDESRVPSYTLMDHMSVNPVVEQTRYPKPGDPNPEVKLGFVSASGGSTRWIDLGRYREAQPLVVRVGWTKDSNQVLYQVQNREQAWLELNAADIRNGTSQMWIRETSMAWVEPVDGIFWLKDGSFLWAGEQSGWRHIYHYAPSGKLIRRLTSGTWEVRSLFGADPDEGWVYFSANERSAGSVDVFRVRMDGTGLIRLTQKPGTHQANFSPDFKWFIDTWSDVTTPLQVRMHRADGSEARVIDANRVMVLEEFRLSKPEFLQIKARDGFLLEALLLKPPDFNPAKKYPVLIYNYGGPRLPLVRNSWGSTTGLWHQMLAQRGYLIWICDNRIASGKGVQSAWPVYRNFGELEFHDLQDGVNWLKAQPYVDAERIGIWGWSFGGYMVGYALTHSTDFRMGIAGAPVTDWRLYDSIYTERYMGLLQNNPSGYDKSSLLKSAGNLAGRLLLIHGLTDDNVHFQNSVQWVYELQKAGKKFELMVYPRSRHAVTDPLLVKHLRTLMTDFILEHL